MLKALATGALALVATTGGGSARPDLVERTATMAERSVTLGGYVRVTDAVRNAGRARAARSTTAYYLARTSVRIRLGVRAVGPLRAGATSRGSAILRVKAVPLGFYRVLVCADSTRRVRESNESNNCRTTPHGLTVNKRSGDTEPPAFAGLAQAVTCIPGPIGTGKRSAYRLAWKPATDDVTPAAGIVYDVYQATTTRGESFAAPTYTTSSGATEFVTPKLPSDETYYFVVRARDRAGNRDANRVERAGENICLVP